jgi:transcriptional regulator of arginine metabolism
VNTHSGASALRRRDEILKVIRETPVHSQEELQQRLRDRGFLVAQPTLSRDLRDLGLAKSPRGYVAPEPGGSFAPSDPLDRAHREERMERALRAFAVSVATAGSLVVVKTPSASAHTLCRTMDEAELPDSVGTIAGDDTIFLAPRARSAASSAAPTPTSARSASVSAPSGAPGR